MCTNIIQCKLMRTSVEWIIYYFMATLLGIFFFVSFKIIEVSIKPRGGHTAQGELESLSPPLLCVGFLVG